MLQPYWENQVVGLYYFPKVSNDWHQAGLRSSLGAKWFGSRAQVRLSVSGLLTLQNDTLYRGYPIDEEYKGVELDTRYAQQIGIRLRWGERLSREKQYSRVERELFLYGDFPFHLPLAPQWMLSGAWISADSTRNDYFRESMYWYMALPLVPTLELQSTWSVEYRYYAHERPIPREDWVWEWQPKLNWKVSSSLQSSVRYSFIYQKTKHSTADNLHVNIRDHRLEWQWVWTPKWDRDRLQIVDSPFQPKAPWTQKIPRRPTTQDDRNREWIQESMPSHHVSPSGGSCRE